MIVMTGTIETEIGAANAGTDIPIATTVEIDIRIGTMTAIATAIVTIGAMIATAIRATETDLIVDLLIIKKIRREAWHGYASLAFSF